MKGLVSSIAASSVVLLAGMLVPAGAAAAPPANDAFASAQVIGPGLPIEVSGSTIEATAETGEELPAEGHTVWFSWTAPASIPVRVDVCDYHVVNGPGNEGLWAYTGTTIPTLVTVAENFTGCKVSFSAVEGTTYRIRFDTYFGGEGNFVLKMIQETPPANDNFSAAQPGARVCRSRSPARTSSRRWSPASRTTRATTKPTSLRPTPSGTAGPPHPVARSRSGTAKVTSVPGSASTPERRSRA